MTYNVFDRTLSLTQSISHEYLLTSLVIHVICHILYEVGIY